MLRIRIVLILIAACSTLTATACAGSTPDASATSVVASVYPLAFAAEAIGGGSVRVRNVTPPGVEPHDLEATPRDVQELREADLVLLVGEGFQPQLEDAAGDGEAVLRVLDLPAVRPLADADPHVWLDPVRFAAVAERIGTALDRRAGAERLAGRLRALDREYRTGLAGCAHREIVTSHAAFAYLADRYDLTQVALTGSSPEAEPGPRDLERAVDAVRASGATTVFSEPLLSSRVAETVAREAGAKTAVLNPVEGLTEAEAGRGEDYFSLMRANLAALRKALRCR